jgi:hypothetical protein
VFDDYPSPAESTGMALLLLTAAFAVVVIYMAPKIKRLVLQVWEIKASVENVERATNHVGPNEPALIEMVKDVHSDHGTRLESLEANVGNILVKQAEMTEHAHWERRSMQMLADKLQVALPPATHTTREPHLPA